MVESRSVEGDEVHAKLVAAIEKPERAHLWVPADAIDFTPHVLPLVYGDGRALFALATINQRPAYWVIRACSTWGCGMDRDSAPGPDFAELTDDILTDLEDAFGSGRCGYSGESLFWPKEERHCDCEECQDDYVAKWPEVDGYGGCSWSRMDWPAGFDVVPHPLSGRGNLLAPPPSPQVNLMGLDEATKQKLREALRFSASRSVMSAEDERRILTALDPSPVQHVEALEAIRRLSSLDDAIGGASAVVMSRMADIHQHADAALTPAPVPNLEGKP